MKCPLMTDKDYSAQLERKLNPGDCLKEECAWWDVTDQLCCLRTLAKSAYFIHGDLREMRDKMPTKGQFRR